MQGNEGGIEVSVLRTACPERERCEADLLAGEVALPLIHRCLWTQAFGGTESWFLAARDSSGTCRGGFMVLVDPSRALPKHVLLRVRRCGPLRADGAIEKMFATLTELARQNSRILRVNVELFSPDSVFRTMAGKSLASLGFRPVAEPRSYTDTISIDLSPTEEAIFDRFHKKTRRDIRAVAKHALEDRTITDPAFGI